MTRAVWFPVARSARPKGRCPLISAVMVTGQRPHLAKVAIACYQAQTWPRRELIILDQARDDRLRRHVERLGDKSIRHVRIPRASRETLGALRNRAAARARGEWICHWDDDDLSHPARMAVQIAAARLARAHAAFLFRVTLWRPLGGQLAWSGSSVWENSMLVRRSMLPRYPSLRRGEDTVVARALLEHGTVAILDEPRLYVYVEHGANTSSAAHMAAIWTRGSRAASGPRARAWLRALDGILPMARWRRALSRSLRSAQP
jgi:glycosyltransferase involved in cell wall biosynthesis